MRSIINRWLYCYLAVVSLACTKEDAVPAEDNSEQVQPEPTEVLEEEAAYPRMGDTGEVLIYNPDRQQPGYVMVNDAGANRVYLMAKDTGGVLYEWELEHNIGNDVELLPDGRVLASLAIDDPDFSFGGYGGKVQLIEADGTVSWDYDVASDRHLSHHDVEMLPNGNVLIIVWDARTYEEAKEKGYSSDQPSVYTERLIEVNPLTDEIVWEWDSWDHLIQDVDATRSNFGSVSENPQKIDINFVDRLQKDIAEDGDLMHANGLDYDVDKDVIYLSVNFFSEVWVIDHSTSTEEARSSSGGTYGKGGDLIYRFGNPSAYGNTQGRRLFYYNHFPNLLEKGEPGEGNMLIYVNRNETDLQSTVYELDLPETFQLLPDTDNEPAIAWEFTDEGLFSPKVSGAVRLANGNTLITCGVFGFWEVTPDKEIVWQFRAQGFFWRGYHYQMDDPALLNYLP
jgi:hypothetical protein